MDLADRIPGIVLTRSGEIYPSHDGRGILFFFLNKLIIGNTRGFIRGKALATLNDIPSTVDTYTKSQIDSKLAGKANASHTHSQYVTTSQINSIIEDYVPTISRLGNIVFGTMSNTIYTDITFSSSCKLIIFGVMGIIEIFLRTSSSSSFTGFGSYVGRHRYNGNTIGFDYPVGESSSYGYAWFA